MPRSSGCGWLGAGSSTSSNLVEVNWPDVETLDESVRADVVDRDDLIPQTGEAARATLDVEPVR